MKKNMNFPIFDSFEEMMIALKKQSDYHMRKQQKPARLRLARSDRLTRRRRSGSQDHPGDTGEESLELLSTFGIPVGGIRPCGEGRGEAAAPWRRKSATPWS